MENVWMAKGTAAFSPRIFVSQKRDGNNVTWFETFAGILSDV